MEVVRMYFQGLLTGKELRNVLGSSKVKIVKEYKGEFERRHNKWI